MPSDIVAAVMPLATVLDRLGAPFQVGGSVASSLRGVARTTLDVDLVANLHATHVTPLCTELEADYYVPEEAIRAAVRERTSFNLIHLDTMLKVDVFVLNDEPFNRSSFARGTPRALDPGDATTTVPVSSAEDIVLHKLEWYRLGGGISERQWLDVLGVLRVGGEQLDMDYLNRWAGDLGLTTLLSRALAEAQVSRGTTR